MTPTKEADIGWSGYGIYDGDGTFTVQIQTLEIAGYKNDAPLPQKEGNNPAEVWDMDEAFIVADEALAKVYAAFPKIVKRLGLDNVIEKNEAEFETAVLRKRHSEEDILVPLTMVADFFLRHEAAMPGKLRDRAVQATKLLIDSEHTKDFDSPASRRRELRKHLLKLENFKPKFRHRSGKIVKAPAPAAKKKAGVGEGAETKVARPKRKP